MIKLLCLLVSIILVLTGAKPEINRINLSFVYDGKNLRLGFDPVIVFYADNLDFFEKLAGWGLAGFAVGDVVAIKNEFKDDKLILQHEMNHVKQFRALGDYFYLAGWLGLNLEGYPYYATGPLSKCNETMWKPPNWWPFRWHLIDLEVPIK